MNMTQPQPNSKREYWRTHFEQWRASGFSAAAYCRQSDLRVTTFYYWKSVFEKSTTKNAPGSPSAGDSIPGQQPSAFIPVSPFSLPEALTLTVGDATLNLPRNMTEAELSTWVRALRSA